MRGKTTVFVYASDPLSAAGAKAQLMNEAAIELVGPVDMNRARVALLVADCTDEGVARVARTIQRDGVPHVVVVAGRFDEKGVVAATAAGVTSFLRRSEATTSRLVAAIRDADESGCRLPESLIRKAAAHHDDAIVVDLIDGSPEMVGGRSSVTSTATVPRLSVREAEVLRLVADGYDTSEVAEKLAYSESTIKGILAKVMTRTQARNRCHAVAIAVRQGLI